jgi:hypothetical protein
MIYRIKNVYLPSVADGSAGDGGFIAGYRPSCFQTGKPVISACKADIEKLVGDVNTVLNNKVKEDNLKNVVKGDLRLVTKITALTKDDEKAAYYKDHPLPELYTLSEETPNQNNNSTGDNQTESKLSTTEKIIRGIAIGIIAISVLGLPLYFVLENRRKKIQQDAESRPENKSDKEKTEEDNSDSDERK